MELHGLVLAGGKGTRLRPFTYTGAKQLVPLANKPVLFYALEQLVAAGVTEIGIVVGDTAAEVEAAVGDGSRFGARVTYLLQAAPLGIAHGILTAAEFLGDNAFVLFLGDNFLRAGIAPLADRFRTGDLDALLVLTQVADPTAFGIAELDFEGRVTRVVEKPRQPRSSWAVTGIYFFRPTVFAAARSIRPSARGELEITDTIQALIDAGRPVAAHQLPADNPWIDTGKMEDMLEANRLVLETLTPRIDPSARVDAESQLIGRVSLEAGAVIERSVIRGPAIVGERTTIVDSYLGPFTAVYHDCAVQGSELEHSIMLEHSRLDALPQRIEESLIGRQVVVTRSEQLPRAHRLRLGDYSRVNLL